MATRGPQSVDMERLLRALARCDADCPMTPSTVRQMFSCGRNTADKALSRLLQSGQAVRYHPGEYGPKEAQP